MKVHFRPLAGSLSVIIFFFASEALGASASGFGAEVEVGRPQGGYVGTMRVAPLHGETGEPFTITAEGLPPHEDFQLVWRTVNGHWNVTDWEYNGREFVRDARGFRLRPRHRLAARRSSVHASFVLDRHDG